MPILLGMGKLPRWGQKATSLAHSPVEGLSMPSHGVRGDEVGKKGL